MNRSSKSILERPESRWSVVPRALLLGAAVVVCLSLFVGTIVGVEAIRVARVKAADRTWRPPASQPSSETAVSLLPPAATTQPAVSSVIPVVDMKPQRIALWASAAKLTGGGIAFGGKRDRVIGGWTSDAARAAWPIDAVGADYYVDVTYSTERDDGGPFIVEAGAETLYATAEKTAGRNTFATVRMGTLTLSNGPSTLLIRSGSTLPKRSLMSLQRIDLRPVGDPESEDAPVVAVGEAVQNAQGLVSGRGRRGWRGGGFGGVEDQRSLLEKLLLPGANRRDPRAQAARDAVVGNIPRNVERPRLEEPAAVVSFEVIDTDRGAPVRTLSEGMSLDVHSLPKNWTVAATVSGAIESVRFEWSEGKNKSNRIEDTPPYAIAGDEQKKYLPAKLALGKYRITATAFSEDQAKGKKGKSLSMTFSIIDPIAEATVTLRATDGQVRGKQLRLGGEKDQRFLGTWSRKEDVAAWNLRPRGAGLYTVELLYSCDRKEGGGVFELTVGDHHFTGTAKPTKGWDDYRTLEVGKLTITDSKQPVTLKAMKLDDGKSLMNVREIRFTRVR